MSQEDLSPVFLTKSDTNQSRLWKVVGLYNLCSGNQNTDQLHSNRAADLRFFRKCNKIRGGGGGFHDTNNFTIAFRDVSFTPSTSIIDFAIEMKKYARIRNINNQNPIPALTKPKRANN